MLLEEDSIGLRCRKVGTAYALIYLCPETGVQHHISSRNGQRFTDKDEALAWGAKNVDQVLSYRSIYSMRQKWRSNSKLLKQFNEYSKWRRLEYPRTAGSELAVIGSYVLPFFVTHLGIADPNRWWEFGEEFADWLKNTARTKSGRNIAQSTSEKTISLANQYLKWMRRKKYIAYDKFRPFEGFKRKKSRKRDFRKLVSDELFSAVHEDLKKRDPLYADLWYVQRHMGFRIGELLAIPFSWISESCADFITSEFEAKGRKVYGAIALESQSAQIYRLREPDGTVARVPLKGRSEISPEFSRTVPILDEELWNILFRRYEIQFDLFEARKYGDDKESYLLFDGARYAKYLDLLKAAYESLGLVSAGTHILRHTISTDWTKLRIGEKVSELVLGHKADAHEVYVHIVAQVNAEQAKALPPERLRKNVVE